MQSGVADPLPNADIHNCNCTICLVLIMASHSKGCQAIPLNSRLKLIYEHSKSKIKKKIVIITKLLCGLLMDYIHLYESDKLILGLNDRQINATQQRNNIAIFHDKCNKWFILCFIFSCCLARCCHSGPDQW